MFLQGGASTQFTMLPLNLAKGRKAYYLVGGSWGKKAYAEAVKLSKTVPFEPLLLASSEDTVYDHIPTLIQKILIQKLLMFTSQQTIQLKERLFMIFLIQMVCQL